MSCTKMDRPSDIEVLCRLCLVKDQVHIPIFEEQGDIRQIFLKISCCLPVSISREDNLPKKICDNCSNKLDSLYEFWNTSVNAEKTLLSWLGQAGVKYTDNAISAVVQQITKPETEIKIEDETFEDGEVEPIEINDKDDEAEEIDDGEMEDFDDGEVEDIEDDEPPPPKRARRSAALKAQETLANISDDDEDEEFDTAELVTEVKEESDESEGEVKDPSILNAVPGTSANDQPGPSGLGKNGPDAPLTINSMDTDSSDPLFVENLRGLDAIQHPRKRGKIHLCDFCDKSYTGKRSLTIHVELNHSDNNHEPSLCNVCGKSFKHEHYLRQHAMQHLKSIGYLACIYCGKSFSNKGNLNIHLKHQHSEKSETFSCDLCDKSFKCLLYLTKHIKSVHSVNCKMIKCNVCDKYFNDRSLLQKHIRRIHENRERLKCHFCDKSYKYKYDMLNHIKNKHPGMAFNK